MTHLVYEGTEYPIAAELVLGRQRDCGVVIADGKASRHHARVFTKPDATVWVEDLDSANGTRVNGEEIFSPRRLLDGDRIVIGKASVVLHGESPATTPAAGQAALPDDGKELIGKELAGYRLDAVLGAGAMGVVYSATQVAMKRAVAVKVFNPALVAREEGFAARLLAAARRSGSVQHPGIAQIHDCGEQDGHLYYSMELVEGDTLEDLIARDGRVEPGLALLVVDQAATALQAAHAKGVFHFGVTAANLMLASDGHVKLLDLGLVSVLDSARHRTRDAQAEIVGNPWYTSPERAAGKEGDARSDVYSLGCVLFHLIAGEPPFDDASPRAILEAHRDRPIPNLLERLRDLALPAKLDELVHGMLSKNPAWRHAGMDEMLVELRVVRGLVAALPPRAAEKAQEKAKEPTPAPAPRPRARRGPEPISSRIEAAAQGAVDRIEAQDHRRLRRSLMWVLVVVAIGVGYAMSGLSLSHGIHSGLDKLLGPDPDAAKPVADGPKPAGGGDGTAVQAGPAAGSPAARWRAVQAAVDGLVADHAWGAAEMRLRRFGQELTGKPGTEDIKPAVTLRLGQLALDGSAWYRERLAALPAPGAPAVAQRLAGLDELRDLALSGNRGEAEALYQETLAKLVQQLQNARRQARLLLAGGRPEALPALAGPLDAAFTGTPVAGLYRQFAALVGEAAAVKPLWRGDWPTTRAALPRTKGAPALAAGAALLLDDDAAAARTLLLNEPALAEGAALRRREALFGREAAVLGFDSPGDIQFIDTLSGEVRIEGGKLTAKPGEACALACTVPVGGASWSASCVLALADQEAGNPGQALITCTRGERPDLLLRIEGEELRVVIHAQQGFEETRPQRPAGKVLHLRLVSRAAHVQVVIEGQVVAECAAALIPAGSQLHLELAGLDWSLDDLQVVGEQ